jgi:titin
MGLHARRAGSGVVHDADSGRRRELDADPDEAGSRRLAAHQPCRSSQPKLTLDTSDNSAAAAVTVNAFPVTFTVTSTNNGGVGSLRQAITDANANVGSTNTISFNVGGGGPQTITPLSGLPNITNPVVIDGTTQPGFSGTPLIELNGASAGAVNGLRISAGNSTVRGLVINRFVGATQFASAAISLDTNGNNVIQGNYLGTNAAGDAALPNNVGVRSNTPNNLIGGTTSGARNLISGNTGNGVDVGLSTDGVTIFTSGTGTIVQGNFIGTNAAGTAPVPNGFGANVQAPNVTVGGSISAAGNLISGNTGFGVGALLRVSNNLSPGGGSSILVQGNLIGTDVSGTLAIPNSPGLSINEPNAHIGGAGALARNVISGNNGVGIELDTQTLNSVPVRGGTNALIENNIIGLNAAGTARLPNTGNGIRVTTLGNVIGPNNVVSGNGAIGSNVSGIAITTGAAPNGGNTTIAGNYIGTNAAGTAALANTGSGIDVFRSGNTVGPGNVISGNAGTGVVLSGASATGNQVIGNLIGTDKNGTNAVPNLLLQSGINITNGASNNLIGTPGAGNVVSGNAKHAITVCCSTATSGNTIQGNFVGTDVTGTAALGNGGIGIDVVSAANTTIGGAGAARNVVSANANWGIQIRTNAANIVVQGNIIGSDVTGTVSLGNGFQGIHIQDTSVTPSAAQPRAPAT